MFINNLVSNIIQSQLICAPLKVSSQKSDDWNKISLYNKEEEQVSKETIPKKSKKSTTGEWILILAIGLVSAVIKYCTEQPTSSSTTTKKSDFWTVFSKKYQEEESKHSQYTYQNKELLDNKNKESFHKKIIEHKNILQELRLNEKNIQKFEQQAEAISQNTSLNHNQKLDKLNDNLINHIFSFMNEKYDFETHSKDILNKLNKISKEENILYIQITNLYTPKFKEYITEQYSEYKFKLQSKIKELIKSKKINLDLLHELCQQEQNMLRFIRYNILPHEYSIGKAGLTYLIKSFKGATTKQQTNTYDDNGNIITIKQEGGSYDWLNNVETRIIIIKFINDGYKLEILDTSQAKDMVLSEICKFHQDKIDKQLEELSIEGFLEYKTRTNNNSILNYIQSLNK